MHTLFNPAFSYHTNTLTDLWTSIKIGPVYNIKKGIRLLDYGRQLEI